MPSLLQKSPSIQENLLRSLMALNDSGSLTYLIQELNGRKISQEAEVFILISLIIYCYPQVIVHPKRQPLEELYDHCLSATTPQALLDILEKSQNAEVKTILYHYLKQLMKNADKLLSKKNPNLLDHYVQFLMENYKPQSKKPPPLISFLLNDYAQFVANLDKAKPTKRD